MPHKFAKVKYPGTVDEKLSSKVVTYASIQHQCPDIRILHLDGFGFSDHRHISYYTYRLIDFVLTMLLAYSLSISNKNLSTSAFGPCSNAFSATLFYAIPSRPIPPIQQANDFLLHICYSSISILIRARCSLVRGRSTGMTPSGTEALPRHGSLDTSW